MIQVLQKLFHGGGGRGGGLSENVDRNGWLTTENVEITLAKTP